MKKKKSLIVITDRDFIGGAEVNYTEIITSLEENNLQIYFCAPQCIKIESYFSSKGFVNLKYIDLPNEYKSVSNISVKNILINSFSIIKNYKFLKKQFKIIQPNYVISNAILSHLLIAFFPKKTTRINYCVHLQDIVDRRELYGVYGKILDFISLRTNKILTISQAVKLTIKQKYHHKIKILYNPVSPIDIKKCNKNETLTIGMFARYIPWKGHHDLIKIVNSLKSSKKIIFKAYGNYDGNKNYYEKLTQKVKDLGLENILQLNGFTNNVTMEMKKCDIILHLSTKPEPFGRILIEANMCKAHIYAYKGGGVEEIFNNLKLKGKLFDNGQISEIGESIKRFKNHDEKFPSLNELFPRNYVDEYLKFLDFKEP